MGTPSCLVPAPGPSVTPFLSCPPTLLPGAARVWLCTVSCREVRVVGQCQRCGDSEVGWSRRSQRAPKLPGLHGAPSEIPPVPGLSPSPLVPVLHRHLSPGVRLGELGTPPPCGSCLCLCLSCLCLSCHVPPCVPLGATWESATRLSCSSGKGCDPQDVCASRVGTGRGCGGRDSEAQRGGRAGVSHSSSNEALDSR